MADKLELIIEAIDKASGEIKQIRGGVDEMSRSVGSAASTITGLGDISVASLARMAAGFVSVQAVVGAWAGAIRTGFNELVQAEQAEVRFVAALRNRGQASQEALNNARALADEMQRDAGIADDLALSVQATLVQFGGLSGIKLERATRAVFDLAATGKDASTVAFTLAKAASGVAENTSRLGFEMNEALPPAQRFDDLLGQIEESAGGTAKALGETLGGQIERIGATFKELAEAFVKIELARSFSALSAIGVDAGKAGDFLGFFTQVVKGLGDAVAGDNVADKLAKMGSGIATAGENAKAVATPAFKELGATVLTLGQHLSAISGTSIPDFTQEAKGLADGMAETTRLFNAGSISMAEYSAIMATLTEQATKLEEQGIDVPFFDIETITATEEAVVSLTDKQQLLADSVSNLGGDFARMAVMGELSFRNIAQALRAFVADLIAALVRMAIFNALVSAFAGGGGGLGAFAGAGSFGHFGGTASSIPNAPPVAPRLGAPIGGVAVSQSFMGVSERFVRELTEVNSRLARQYGVQFVNAEAIA